MLGPGQGQEPGRAWPGAGRHPHPLPLGAGGGYRAPRQERAGGGEGRRNHFPVSQGTAAVTTREGGGNGSSLAQALSAESKQAVRPRRPALQNTATRRHQSDSRSLAASFCLFMAHHSASCYFHKVSAATAPYLGDKSTRGLLQLPGTPPQLGGSHNSNHLPEEGREGPPPPCSPQETPTD